MAAGALFHSADARGQAATPLDRFEPAPAGEAFVTTPSAEVAGDLRLTGGLVLSYANRPLVLTTAEGDDRVADVVDHQLILHNLVGLELAERFKFDLDIPLAISQGGEQRTVGPTTYRGPSGAALADVRLGARAALVRQDGAVPGVGLILHTWLPTGDDEAFTSTGQARIAPRIVVSADYGVLLYGLSFGRRFQPAPTSGKTDLLGSELWWSAGFAGRTQNLTLGGEFQMTTVAEAGVSAFEKRTTSAEILFTSRIDLGPIHLLAGGGPGLTQGVGTPTVRGFLGVTFAPEASAPRGYTPESFDPETGREHDPSPTDGVASEPAANASEAPQPVVVDADGDGIVDARDACPELAGPASEDPAQMGCPPDADRDGIVDAQDACPEHAGVAHADAARHGCPADRDGDSIADEDDACPDTAGKPSTDPAQHGCPSSVRITGEQIVINKRIEFDTGSATLVATSLPILEEVAAVLRDNPEIARVGVDGHTDDQGNEASNVVLSQKRAVAVVRWLVEQGIDARRLEARGYGPRQPIADNETEEGRTQNRRVEFTILKRSEQGQAGWKDGSFGD